ncbi:hypothetical protein FY557_05900 [Chryseobacterium sp. SN22]|uniref:hypothetical protein n=1 Tax=Chryseobacterium sp. SN22 TaxID=2606431 RepID=UPI0011EC270A|nr:hypothetical protein [Chryseobacterium sp. SN22]KAA0129095.1 hypothetical protein FY557_05900 [Chryseobacterium sp. SN22]
MSKDKFQDKYNEIFRDIKEEKMDWDFEDFLKKAEGKKDEAQENQETPIIPISIKARPSFPKWFWMAASVIVLLSVGFIFNMNQHSQIEDQAKLVENRIRQQKNNFIEENSEHQEQVAVNPTNDSLSGAKKDSIFEGGKIAEKDVLDEILPKRGRLKKERKPKYVYHSSKADSTGYKDSYVIVNGKRIDNVEEAINVTKYSFQIFANNVSEKLVQPKVVDDDY